MVFQQTSAPVGWTKQTTHNDKALRVVSGSAGSAGSVAFSTVFGKTGTDGTSTTLAQTASHNHTVSNNPFVRSISGQNIGSDGSGITVAHNPTNDNISINSAGSGNSHSHTMDIRVQYVDIIIARKN